MIINNGCLCISAGAVADVFLSSLLTLSSVVMVSSSLAVVLVVSEDDNDPAPLRVFFLLLFLRLRAAPFECGSATMVSKNKSEGCEFLLEYLSTHC